MIADPFLGISSYGPISQKDFLLSMGIKERLLSLLQTTKSAEERKTLLMASDRLVDPKQMGEIYQFLVLSSNQADVPYCFDP